MSLISVFGFCFIYLCLDFEAKAVFGTENEPNFALGSNQSLLIHDAHNIELKYYHILSELIKDKFDLLMETVKTQKEELDQLKKELKNFITNEFLTQHKKLETSFNTELNSACAQKFVEQNQKLSKDILEKISNQKINQKNLLENAIRTSEPTSQTNISQWDENFNCKKNCGPIKDLPNSCEEVMTSNFVKDGVYLLKIEKSELKPFYAYCKRINGKAWTIIQRREDGSVDFYRNWADYKNGFGNLYGELWLGLERLHAMTRQHNYELHVLMKSTNGSTGYAHYNQFSIASESEKYKLTVSGFSGNATDGLTHWNVPHNGMKFSTKDNKNDNSKDSSDKKPCATKFQGAWWFNGCYMSHLNGLYFPTNNDGIDWLGFDEKLKYAQMAIRRS